MRLYAKRQRFLPRRFELIALAEIGGKGDDIAAIGRLQPFENDRRIQPAGLGQHHFPHVFLAHAVRGHGKTTKVNGI
ncbi:MAG: hypothetical protein WAL37_19245 [Xanthobacteraceae bacterium]